MFISLLTKRWVQIVLLLSLLSVAVVLQFNDAPVIERLRHICFDMYNARMPRPTGTHTIIVDIDEASLKEYGQWPWPRTRVAQLVAKLKELGAVSIAFDVVFAEADRTSPQQIAKNLPDAPGAAAIAEQLRKLPDNDEILAKAIAEAGIVTTGFVGANQETGQYPVEHSSFLYHHSAKALLKQVPSFAATEDIIASAAAGDGSFTAEPDDDGIIRRVPFVLQPVVGGKIDREPLPSLSLEALRVAKGGKTVRILGRGNPDYQITGVGILYTDSDGTDKQLTVPTDKNGFFYMHYPRHTTISEDALGAKQAETGEKVNYISAAQLLDGKVDAARVRGKIAFVGTSAIGLLDLRSSPVNKILPGVEIHATIVNQIIDGDFLERSYETRGEEEAFTCLVGIAIIFFAPFVNIALLALLSLAAIGGWAVWGFHAYQHGGEQFDVVCPGLVIVIIFILSSILSNLRTEMEKRMIRQAFDRYLSPALIEELVKDPSRLKLGGDVRELSVMFTDIRNFTTISESMDPAELIRMMNDFLTPMTSAVLDNKGFVDKYMGDAMMTFWNAPVDDPYHATNACRAALEMVDALKPVNAELRSRAEKAGKPFHELKAGIGINSGKASVGNMGSKQRFAYSALGDTVNLASRMEGQTKTYGVTTMISSSTQALVKEFATLELDLLTVKGRTEPERVFTLLGDEKLAATPEFRSLASAHAAMLEAYRAQDWEVAAKIIPECASLRPDLAALYHLYAERIGYYRAHPPGKDWTGVWVAKEK
jgi:adenylate cyclase